MKEEKVLYLGIVTKPADPDSGYMKLYPKSDGWYSLDSDGNEVKLEGVVIIDEDGQELTQKNKVEFAPPFTSEVSGDKIVVSLDSLGFTHDNDFHDPEFATKANFDAHEDEESVAHGLDVSDINTKIHEQNTDTTLDQGGANEVTAEDIRQIIDSSVVAKLTAVAHGETIVTRDYKTYIADTASGNATFVLPSADDFDGEMFFFRKAHDNNGMTVARSGDDDIIIDDEAATLVTFEDKGDWVGLQSDGADWHLVMSGGTFEIS